MKRPPKDPETQHVASKPQRSSGDSSRITDNVRVKASDNGGNQRNDQEAKQLVHSVQAAKPQRSESKKHAKRGDREGEAREASKNAGVTKKPDEQKDEGGKDKEVRRGHINLIRPWWVSAVGIETAGYAESAGSIPARGRVRHGRRTFRVLSGSHYP